MAIGLVVRRLVFCCTLTRALPAGSEVPTPEELVRKSIGHHDPLHVMLESTLQFAVQESRVDGTSRTSAVLIDFPRYRLELRRTMESGARIELTAAGDRVEASLNGSRHFSEADAARYRITPDRIRWWRDIYLYLYGLPMKLEDPGVRLAPVVERVRFAGKDVYALRVTYDPTVGSEIWYFYFDPDDYSLEGYRFHYDEAKNDGEYVVLEGEVESGGVRLPKRRRWYLNRDGSYYGADTIKSIRIEPR